MLCHLTNWVPSCNIRFAILTSALRIVACSLVGVVTSFTGVPIGHIKPTGVTHVPIVVELDLVGVCGPVAVAGVGITSTEWWKTACIRLTLR